MRVTDKAFEVEADEADESPGSMRLMRRVPSGSARASTTATDTDDSDDSDEADNDNGTEPAHEAATSNRVNDEVLTPLFRRESHEAESDSLIPIAPLKRWTRYGMRAALRHRWLAVLSLGLSVLLVGMLLLAAPPTYESTAAILVQDDRAITFGVNPGRIDPGTGSAGNGVLAVVTNESALNNIIDKAGLLDRDPPSTLFGGIREGIMESIFGKPTEAQRRDALIAELETAIIVNVSTTGEQIDFVVNWPDARQSALIATEAVRVFLDSRYEIEVTAGEVAVDILENNLEVAEAEVTALGGDDVRETDVPRGSKLEQALIVAQAARDQLNQSRLSVEGARAAFQYRYKELQAPRVPTAPTSGSTAMMLATVIVSVGLMLAVCTWYDLRRGRVQELWQIERLGVPIVAVLDPVPTDRR